MVCFLWIQDNVAELFSFEKQTCKHIATFDSPSVLEAYGNGRRKMPLCIMYDGSDIQVDTHPNPKLRILDRNRYLKRYAEKHQNMYVAIQFCPAKSLNFHAIHIPKQPQLDPWIDAIKANHHISFRGLFAAPVETRNFIKSEASYSLYAIPHENGTFRLSIYDDGQLQFTRICADPSRLKEEIISTVSYLKRQHNLSSVIIEAHIFQTHEHFSLIETYDISCHFHDNTIRQIKERIICSFLKQSTPRLNFIPLQERLTQYWNIPTNPLQLATYAFLFLAVFTASFSVPSYIDLQSQVTALKEHASKLPQRTHDHHPIERLISSQDNFYKNIYLNLYDAMNNFGTLSKLSYEETLLVIEGMPLPNKRTKDLKHSIQNVFAGKIIHDISTSNIDEDIILTSEKLTSHKPFCFQIKLAP
jgi:hypothetical protein